MAQIAVRPQGDTAAEIIYVDETWLERFPKDFDRVPEEELARLDAERAKAVAAATGAQPFVNPFEDPAAQVERTPAPAAGGEDETPAPAAPPAGNGASRRF